jgi:hypothetical protein
MDLTMMQLIRKFSTFTALFLLGLFFSFASFPAQVTFSGLNRPVADKIEFNRIIQSCSTEFLTPANVDRLQFHGNSIMKNFFDNPIYSNTGSQNERMFSCIKARKSIATGWSASLDKICKLQI